jgi:hypothetical protein
LNNLLKASVPQSITLLKLKNSSMKCLYTFLNEGHL